MGTTTSLAFPCMFDVAHNQVSVLNGYSSVSNRVRLLMLTEPTELYRNLDFGVGLKRYLWTYNTENQKAIIKDRIAQQIKKYEPCVESDNIQFSDGLLVTGTEESVGRPEDSNKLKLTLKLTTTFQDRLEIDLNSLSDSLYSRPYTISNGNKIYVNN